MLIKKNKNILKNKNNFNKMAHNNASKQLEAINLAKNNILNKGNVTINLQD